MQMDGKTSLVIDNKRRLRKPTTVGLPHDSTAEQGYTGLFFTFELSKIGPGCSAHSWGTFESRRS
jgi:hypothetical protein